MKKTMKTKLFHIPVLIPLVFIIFLFQTNNAFAEDFYGSEEYTIQSGDILLFNIFEQSGYPKEIKVDESGYIDNEYLGRLFVRNHTLTELRKIFEHKISVYFRNYPITLTIKEYHTQTIMVVGVSEKIVKFTFQGSYRIADVFRDLNAQFDSKYQYNIYLRRGYNLETKINGNELIFNGNLNKNYIVKDGDLITVETLYPLKSNENLITYYPSNQTIKREFSIFGLNLKEIEAALNPVKSAAGNIVINSEFNKLYIEDYPENISKVSNVIDYFVRNVSQVKQILIEAKIFEVVLNDNEVFGINWQAIADRHNVPYSIFNTERYNYNLVTFRDRELSYTVILDAIKERGNVNTLSVPNIITLNQKTATIAVGEQVPYLSSTSGDDDDGGDNDNTYEFKDIFMNLTVTPDVLSDTLVKLDIKPEISSVSGQTSNENPIINTRKAATNVVLENNSYLFMGGILSERKVKSKSRVPFLGSLPLFNLLLAKRNESVIKTELVILLKCSILNSKTINELYESRSKLISDYKTR
ncbi:MAG TPA: polysaccharide biosynthesis/export family protein [bacterium]|nr:polysaccharide biosynthesis/export family protein [bacterium]